MDRLTYKNIIHGVLNSYTMVFFSQNKIFGLILIITSFFDFHAGLGGLFAVLISMAFSVILNLDKKKITEGLYGFNALLTGLGAGIAFQPSPSLYFILVFVVLATLFITIAIEGILYKYGLSYLTIPFLLTTWLMILARRSYTSIYPGDSGIFLLNTLYQRGGVLFVDLYEWFDNIEWPLYIKTYFRSLGAIIFQYHLFSGILIAIGLLLYSRIAFLYSIIGFTAAWFFYIIAGADIHELDYSYVGFNHILTAIAIGSFFTIPSIWTLFWVLFITPVTSLMISGSIQFLNLYQLPVFSLPFNLVVLLFLYTLKLRHSNFKRPELIYIQHFSPEKNLYANLNSNSRFSSARLLPINLPFEGYRFVSQSHDGEYTHKDEWRHAWDFIILDGKGKEFERDGASLFDYYNFNKPVTAPANGWIEEVVDHVEDNQPGQVNLDENWGNTVVIKHGEQLYSKLSHLKKESVLYPKGTYVTKGQVIAQSGNSGRSPFPHLHFQIQSNPYIGSATIRYPISQYINFNGGHKLVLSGFPDLNDQVSNIEPDSQLVRAFNFVPGQNIRLIVDGKSECEWNVMADMLNNIYIKCRQTDSIAWVKNDGNLFYFTHFEGNRKSILYYFFLAAYQIPLGYYPDITIKDIFPPTIAPYSPLNFIQDFAAPFFLFIKPNFKCNIQSDGNSLAVYTIKSEAKYRLAGFRIIDLHSEITISEKGIQHLDIYTKGKSIKVIFIREDL